MHDTKFDQRARYTFQRTQTSILFNMEALQDNEGSDNQDANEHNEKVLEIVDLFLIPEDVILFYKGLDVPTRHILDSKGAIPTMKVVDAKVAIQEMADHSQKWHNGTEIKKVNEKVYAAQVRYESCGGPHYTRDCAMTEEGKTLDEAYYN
nr:hypothetical protein [Tanacetum cinerariifolium]